MLDEAIGKEIGCEKMVGSTAIIGLITMEVDKQVLYTANVGDSQGFIYRNGGQFAKLSVMHTCRNSKEKERIKKAGGVVFKNRVDGCLAVTRAFGDFAFKSHGVVAVPSIKRIELRMIHKYIVLASDGIWDVIDAKVTTPNHQLFRRSFLTAAYVC